MENIIEESSANNKTLSIWLVTEAALSEEVKQSVNQAMNEITQAKFGIYVFVNFLTEDEYYDTVEDEIRTYENSKNAFATDSGEATVGVKDGDRWYVAIGDEKIYALPEGQRMGQRENGEWYIAVGKDRFEKRYPIVRAHQVDVVYVSGEEMYTDYVSNGWLASLDSELSASSKKIKEYLSATLLEAAKIQKNTYAIPNNRELGEYTFMLLDKSLMDETFMSGIYNQGKINGFFNSYVYSYLETVRQKDATVQPVAATYEYCLDMLAHYWAIDPDTYQADMDAFSVLGYYHTDPKTFSKDQTILSFDSLFANEDFCENYTKLNELDMKDFFLSAGETADGKAAIKFETGNYAKYEEYMKVAQDDSVKEGYYPVIVKYPTVDAETVYESMFGVCSYSVDLAASMQVLTYLNTNADFRNLVQYGVLGEHYKLHEVEGTVQYILDNEGKPLYSMDLFKTGNAFIAYLTDGMKKDVWEDAKAQNREVLLDPLLDFDFAALVKKTEQSDASALKVGSSGYVYTYESGYSKDVVSQNTLLKKWIDRCDAAGKGVYVLHTGVLDGQNFTGKIYYYNNNIVGATVKVTDGDEALEVKYEGTVGEGSDVIVITFSGKKNSSNLTFGASVNGAAVETSVTYQNSALNFDFFNTEYYAVDFDANVTKAMILENDAIWNWIYEGDSANTHSTEKPNVAVYEGKADDNGTREYTYVVYMPVIAKRYNVSFLPTVSGTELNLNVSYVASTADLAKTDATYAIFMVTAQTKAPMTAANFNLTVNNQAVAAEGMVVEKLEADPKVAISGTLDVELVKYIDYLNTEIVDILADFKATGDTVAFKALVNYLHELLKVKSVDSLYKTAPAIPALPDLNEFFSAESMKTDAEKKTEAYNGLKTFAESLDASELYRSLLCATSSAEVPHKKIVVDDKGNEKLEETKKISEIYTVYEGKLTENYKYYSSPYALYIGWLKENGYTK